LKTTIPESDIKKKKNTAEDPRKTYTDSLHHQTHKGRYKKNYEPQEIRQDQKLRLRQTIRRKQCTIIKAQIRTGQNNSWSDLQQNKIHPNFLHPGKGKKEQPMIKA